jgi:hypothetical protein
MSASCTLALISRMGSRCVAGVCRSRSVRSNPFSRGIITSSTAMSSAWSAASWNASSPSRASMIR